MHHKNIHFIQVRCSSPNCSFSHFEVAAAGEHKIPERCPHCDSPIETSTSMGSDKVVGGVNPALENDPQAVNTRS